MSEIPPGGPPPGPPPGGPPPASGPPGSGSSAAAPTSGGGDNTNRNLLIIAGVLVVLALAAGAFVLLSGDDDADELTLAQGEVFLEPAAESGPDPFTEKIDVAPAETLASRPPPGETTTTSSPAGPSTTATTAAIPSAVGSTPGLYGGTQDTARCDPGQLRTFLEANPDKAAAWVAAQNADPTFEWSDGPLTTANVGAYIATLTPITLVTDTRVTNHGFVSGQPTPRAAVLQAGTAVLVDKFGTPRVKCNCGNPLIPPVAVQGATTYTGSRWPGFSPTTIVVVQPAPVIIDIFILIDIDTGGRFSRPAATTGADDTPTDTPPQTVPTTVPPTEPPGTTILSATDFCGAIAEYDNLGNELSLDDEDAWLEFAISAFTELERLAPDDIQPEVELLLNAVQAGDYFAGDNAAYEAADERWYQWTLDNCGYDWYAND